MRDAQSALDQLISFCGDKIQEADVLSMFGLTAQKQLLDLSGAVLAGEVEGALRQLNDLAGHGKDLARLLADLLNHFRNLLIFQVSRGDLSLLEVAEAEGAALAEQAKLASAEGLTRILEVLGDADLRLRDTSSKKILIEVALLKAIEARNALSLDTVLIRLEGLRAESAGGQAVSLQAPAPAHPERRPQPAAASQAVSAPAPAPHRGAGILPASATQAVAAYPSAAAPESPRCSPRPESTEAGAQNAAFRRARRAHGRSHRAMGQLARGGWPGQSLHAGPICSRPTPFRSTRTCFTIGFDPEFEGHMGLADTARTHSLLQTKLGELGYPNVQFKFIRAEAPARPAPPSLEPQPAPKTPGGPACRCRRARERQIRLSVPVSQEDFKNDPLIRKALEIFKGQIVEVRA